MSRLRDCFGDTSSDDETVDEMHFNDVDDDDDDDDDDDEGAAVVPQDDQRLHAKRGYSVGIYGRVPAQPYPIRLIGRVIDSPTATRTLLAIMRVNWPLGCFGTVDVKRRCPEWWQKIYEEFLTYYTHDPKCGTAEQAQEAIMFHMRNNMRKILNNERRRVLAKIEKEGGTFYDYKPDYLSTDLWRSFCDYWASEKFKKKQTAARSARKKVSIKHITGAKSFMRCARELAEVLGHEPGNYDLFIHTHTKKGTGDYTSARVQEIVELYLDMCRNQNMEPSSTPIDTWVQTVGVQKNTIIGVPRTRASDIIPSQKKASRTRRRDGEGSSGRTTVQAMTDDIVLRAVDRTLSYARANPGVFGLSTEQISTLASSVAQGVSDLPDDHPLSQTTMQELVHVMVQTLDDIHRRHKGKSVDQVP